MKKYLLAIDQGTTNSRAMIFDVEGRMIGHHDAPLTQSFPKNGWVEQDPMEMFSHTVACCQSVFKKTGISPRLIASIGITNQRETTILWDKQTGKPIYPAIVWQDRRTTEYCKQVKSDKLAEMIQKKTGLLLDPYFSATKILWILDEVKGAREQARRGEILFGTVDSWLLWKLTGGLQHATDVTNASRTMLFNIHTLQWDSELLEAFDIPAAILPAVKENVCDFGVTQPSLFGSGIPIGGMVGDQQAALVGQACFQQGMVKATFGTGCFMVLHTGKTVASSTSQLLSTVAYRINGETAYALEGSIFSAGTTVKWLRDQLHLISSAAETETLALSIPDTGGVYLVPAFTGLGAPHWNPNVRGAITGLTRNTNRAHIARAALESVVYQAQDLLYAMENDHSGKLQAIRVDGGMAANNWMLQFLSDMLNLRIDRPACIETTALGAAYLAGLQSGFFNSIDQISSLWQLNEKFMPKMEEQNREKLYQGWQIAVKRVM